MQPIWIILLCHNILWIVPLELKEALVRKIDLEKMMETYVKNEESTMSTWCQDLIWYDRNNSDEYYSLPLFIVQYIIIIETYYVIMKLCTSRYKEPRL